MQYQYENGFLDKELYEGSIQFAVIRLALLWQQAGIRSGGPGFEQAIEQWLEDEKRQQQSKDTN